MTVGVRTLVKVLNALAETDNDYLVRRLYFEAGLKKTYEFVQNKTRKIIDDCDKTPG